MLKKWIRATFVIASVLGFSALAQADQFKWTLVNVGLHDGSRVSGSFVINYDKRATSQIDISVTPNGGGGVLTFNYPCTVELCEDLSIFADRETQGDMTNTRLFVIGAPPLSEEGSTEATIMVFTCLDSICDDMADPLVNTSGTVEITPFIPPPAPTIAAVPSLDAWSLLLLTAMTICAAGYLTTNRRPT